MTSRFKDRCKTFVQRMSRDAMLRQGSPVDDLAAFVQSEIGRTVDARLDDTCSLILYFGSETDRAEFKALILEAKPGMMVKDIP